LRGLHDSREQSRTEQGWLQHCRRAAKKKRLLLLPPLVGWLIGCIRLFPSPASFLSTYSHPQPPPKKWRPAFSARPHPNLILSVPNPAILSTINLTFFFRNFRFYD
jgi:hypothetical protein